MSTRQQQLEAELRRIVTAVAADAGVELVDLALKGGGSRRILRCDIDRPGPRGVTLDDCQRVSRALGIALDEHDELIAGAYTLEVSSPGIDRPIRTEADIRRNTGRPVVVTVATLDGQRTHHGTLLGAEAGVLRLAPRDAPEELRIPLDEVVHACQDPTI